MNTNLKLIPVTDYIDNKIWSLLIFFGLILLFKNRINLSEQAKGVSELCTYSILILAFIIIVFRISEILKNFIKTRVIEDIRVPEAQSKYEELLFAVEDWIAVLKMKLNTQIPQNVKIELLAESAEVDSRVLSFYKLFHLNFVIPYPKKTKWFNLIYIKNFDIFVIWFGLGYDIVLGVISIIPAMFIMVFHQFLSSRVNRKVLYYFLYFAFRYAVLYILYTGAFSRRLKNIAAISLMKVSEKLEPGSKLIKEVIEFTGEPMEEGLPPIKLIGEARSNNISIDKGLSERVNKVFENLELGVRFEKCAVGAAITKVWLELDNSVRIKNLMSIQQDVAMMLKVESINIVSSSEGMTMEIPNREKRLVTHREVMEKLRNEKFGELSVVIGENSVGEPFQFDLYKLPHLLIAGATNMGKSVCLNTIIASLLLRRKPDELKFLLIDPKQVEFTMFENLPHLARDVVKGIDGGLEALRWCINEMERRYSILASMGIKKLHELPISKRPFPILIIIIDEIADLVMAAGKEVDSSIARLAGKARAAGMHLVLATQRPDSKVLSGLIRSNILGRIALKTNNSTDSTIILDQTGAETLTGQGEMLIKIPGRSNIIRCQGSFIEDKDMERLVDWCIKNMSYVKKNYLEQVPELDKPLENDVQDYQYQRVNRNYTDELREYIKKIIHDGETSLPGQNKLATNILHCDVRRVRQAILDLRQEGILQESNCPGIGDKIIVEVKENNIVG